MAAVTICSDFWAQKNKVSHCFHCFPIYLPWSDAMILVFWTLSFKPTFSLSSFTFIKSLFSSSLLSAISVVSSQYLRLLIFLPAILILACASSSPVFLMMYSAYKLNKQGDNILVDVMEFQLSYSKSWKMMLWKCCTQYASKFGKLSSGDRTGKGQFSFQSQRKAMPKNTQTTAQLHSSHTLVK